MGRVVLGHCRSLHIREEQEGLLNKTETVLREEAQLSVCLEEQEERPAEAGKDERKQGDRGGLDLK